MLLAGLEHLDDRYLKAVGYATKSKRGGLPKMVLVGDIVGDDADAVARATSEVVRLANARSGEGFVAVSAEARKKFWLDRKRTAAISKHTNAFKINEDVVIPLPRMGEYTEGIERINIELSLANKLALVDGLEAFFRRGNAAARQERRRRRDRVGRAARGPGAAGAGAAARGARAVAAAGSRLDAVGRPQLLRAAAGPHACAPRGRRRSARRCNRSSPARRFEPIVDECQRIHARCCKGRVWVALHMHAGDGNVHTNIPVNSDNYEMLQTAHEAVARIMALARSLDGVISGEHGIGITKLEFLTDDELAAFTDYKQRVDPEGRFNKGKLLRGAAAATADAGCYADLTNAYTPSFGLMGHESLIMQQSDIGEIADSIKDCLRCGKCKPVCATHVPRANLLYSPRNKILATSLLVEAFLYEEQTRRGVVDQALGGVRGRRRPLHRLPQVPGAVPGGHRLRRRLDEHAQPAAQDGAEELPARQRGGDVVPQRDPPGDDQGHAHGDGRRRLQGAARRPTTCCAAWRNKQTAAPPSTRGRGAGQGAGDPLHQQEDAGRAAEEDRARAARHRGQGLRPDHPQPEDDQRPTPRRCSISRAAARSGCSRRSGLATQAMLWHAGVQTVLPPGYLCCGYPQRGSGEYDKAEKIITDNRVLFHRVANTLNYLDIKTVVVSCGTCYDQLQGYEFDKIFPGCRIIDIHEFLLEKGITLGGRAASGGGYLYHDPCHSPMKLREPMKTVKALVGENVRKSERCCGESGTLRRHPAGHRDAGALPQGRGAAQGRGGAARADAAPSADEGRRQDPHLLPELPAGPAALQRRPAATACSKPTTSSSRWPTGSSARTGCRSTCERANDGGIERVLV